MRDQKKLSVVLVSSHCIGETESICGDIDGKIAYLGKIGTDPLEDVDGELWITAANFDANGDDDDDFSVVFDFCCCSFFQMEPPISLVFWVSSSLSFKLIFKANLILPERRFILLNWIRQFVKCEWFDWLFFLKKWCEFKKNLLDRSDMILKTTCLDRKNGKRDFFKDFPTRSKTTFFFK